MSGTKFLEDICEVRRGSKFTPTIFFVYVCLFFENGWFSLITIFKFIFQPFIKFRLWLSVCESMSHRPWDGETARRVV